VTRAASLVAATLLLGGCSVLDFDVSRHIPQQRIPGSPLGGTLASVFPGAFTFSLDLQAEAKAHDTGPIGSVHLKSMTLVIDPSSPTRNFDWLHELHVFIESTRQGSTLQRVEIARLAPVPTGVTTLDLQVVGNVDVKPYVDEGPRITSTASATVTPQDVVFDGTIVFRVSPL
jgi:hypothetical protein